MPVSAAEFIYLDYNASTPLAPEVAELIARLAAGPFGNPSSSHWAGCPAREAVERARAQVAALAGCSPGEIVFTSGGSEANNHAIKGVWFASGRPDGHIVTTQVEHPAVLEPCRFLERLGASVTYVAVDGYGRVDPDDIRRALTARTVLVSVMHANNEVGTMQPVAEIARVAHEHGVLFHTDAAQSMGKISATAAVTGADLLSIAGHKLYAPKGVGALYIRKGVVLESLVHGAGHEGGRRAGTENILLDAALGAACDLAHPWLDSTAARDLRDRLWQLLKARFGDAVVLHGHPTERLPNTLNVGFRGTPGSAILERVPEIAASTGSACHTGEVTLSPVLQAMHVAPETGMGAIRFSLGRPTSAAEIDRTVELLAARVHF
ncbi:MAG TPA: cysteine desulfurase family protein [Bryobacteraceae bacterium]|nr:cysteine desulfurase family protein [Bryobacteraceae bacterium]